MEIDSYNLVANARTEVRQPGRFFMLIETGAPLQVDFVRRGSRTPERGRNVEGGYISMPGDWTDPDDGAFDSFVLLSTVNQTVRVGTSYASGDYRRTIAIVQALGPNAGDTVADQAVGAVSAQIAAANASRHFVTVQNTGANNIRVRLGGAATVGRGVQLQPGQSVYWRSTAAIHAIREGGADSSVSVTEETRS